MTEVPLDPRQAPARAELLLAADFGHEARGRPIHSRLESEDGGGEPGPRLKLGAVRTRRLAANEGADRPSASAYGNPLRGTRDDAPVVPIGAPLVARTDVPDAHGWRVYRVAPSGAVIYDGWIEHDPANAELALTELHAAAAASPAAALRQAVERQPDHASAETVTRWLADQEHGRRSAPGEAAVAGGTPAVVARPRAESRPRMTRLTGTPRMTRLTGTPRTTPPSRPS